MPTDPQSPILMALYMRKPDEAEYALAEHAYRAIPFEPPLYARIDMIRADDDRPMLLELELTEPSLFLPYAPGSADRLARKVLALIG